MIYCMHWSGESGYISALCAFLFCPELQGMKSCYIHLIDTFKMSDDCQIELPVMSQNDKSYGLFSLNIHGLANGFSAIFAVLEIDIGDLVNGSDS